MDIMSFWLESPTWPPRLAIMSRPRSPLVVLAALAALLVWTAPAAAHDQLVESDPPADAELATSPEAITLTFSADILDLSSQVVVTDAAGGIILDTPGTVVGPVVTAVIEQPFDVGAHLVTWRVVSSDGHPIDGAFAFTVLQGPTEPEPEPTMEPTTSTAAEPTAEPDPPSEAPAPVAVDQATPPPADGAGETWPVVVGGSAAAAALAAVVTVLVRRRGRTT